MTRLLLVALVFGTAFALEAAEPAIGPFGVTVSDMDRSVRFYTKVLAFRKTGDREFHDPAVDSLLGLFGARVRVVDMQLGKERLQLVAYRNIEGRPVPTGSQSNDRWFQHIAIVVSDMEAAIGRLDKYRVKTTSAAAQRLPAWNRQAGGIEALYFRDPDNHILEVISFPRGKGDPRWQDRHRLFLGIDHTAIVVADTETSLRTYRDKLGLHVAGESRNHGIEQEYLNRVRGARLRITSLRGASGPGIELLEYLRPGVGRAFPRDASPTDIFHWQVTVIAPRYSMPKLARDPDGHALLLTSKQGGL